jgi:DNA-binding NarL/FixJ family response regulator
MSRRRIVPPCHDDVGEVQRARCRGAPSIPRSGGFFHRPPAAALTAAGAGRDNARVQAGRTTRVVVVEDHPIFRDGLVQCLDVEPDFRVVGKWATGAVDPAALATLAPDLVLMDVELPERSGIDATRALRAVVPDLRVVMLTAYADADLLFDAMQAGAAGYLLKHTPPAELVATLRRIVAGEHVLPPTLASRFLREFQSRQAARPHPKLAELSPREEEVLRLLATGETNRQIAKRLFVAEETVKSHVAAIFRKLEVSDRTRAAVLAVKAGLVDA